jgi:hypothetical protein
LRKIDRDNDYRAFSRTGFVSHSFSLKTHENPREIRGGVYLE